MKIVMMVIRGNNVINKILLIIVCSLFSCEKEDVEIDPGTKPADQDCSLVKFNSGTLSVTYNRNDKGVISSIDYDYHAGNLTHQATNLVEYDASNNPVKISDTNAYFEYEYDASGRVQTEKFYDRKSTAESFVMRTQRTFTYNAAGLLDKAMFDSNNYERYEFDSKGNIIKTYFKNSTTQEYLTLEYLSFDDKKSPFYDIYFNTTINLTQTAVLGIMTNLRPARSKNNAISSKIYSPDGSFTTSTTTYVYNDFGYPVKATGSAVIEYEYECK